MQNFKMSAPEYLRCAPKYTINNQNFSGEGAQPDPSPGREGGTPSPHPTHSAPSSPVPPLKNPGYAPAKDVSLLLWGKWSMCMELYATHGH